MDKRKSLVLEVQFSIITGKYNVTMLVDELVKNYIFIPLPKVKKC